MAIDVKEFFSRADRLPFVDLAGLMGTGGALVVAPHPDDESLGCGGLLALCAQEGRAAHVVIVSDGVGSHPASRRYPPDALRHLRERETLEACERLGLRSNDVSCLRLPDTGVPVSGEAAELAITMIAGLARSIAASVTFVTWHADPHCDHEASFTLARAAAQRTGIRLLQYPVWGHTRADGMMLAAPRGCRLAIAAVLDRKIAAIAEHRSQTTRMIDDDPDGFMLSPEMIARFHRPFEVFLED